MLKRQLFNNSQFKQTKDAFSVFRHMFILFIENRFIYGMHFALFDHCIPPGEPEKSALVQKKKSDADYKTLD